MTLVFFRKNVNNTQFSRKLIAITLAINYFIKNVIYHKILSYRCEQRAGEQRVSLSKLVEQYQNKMIEKKTKA